MPITSRQLIQYGPLVLLIIAIPFIATLNNKLDHIEHQLGYKPPTVQPTDEDLIGASQSWYIPAYSHIYIGSGKPVLLTATLSIRNVDATRSFSITSVRYYDTDGRLQRNWLDRPVKLGPLATMEFLVEEHDVTGGSGANFVADVLVPDDVNHPIMEAVMISGASNRGISFVSRGHLVTSPIE